MASTNARSVSLADEQIDQDLEESESGIQVNDITRVNLLDTQPALSITQPQEGATVPLPRRKHLPSRFAFRIVKFYNLKVPTHPASCILLASHWQAISAAVFNLRCQQSKTSRTPDCFPLRLRS